MINENETINLDRQVEEETKPKSNTIQMTSETIKPETVKLEALATDPVMVLLVPLTLVEILLVLV